MRALARIRYREHRRKARAYDVAHRREHEQGNPIVVTTLGYLYRSNANSVGQLSVSVECARLLDSTRSFPATAGTLGHHRGPPFGHPIWQVSTVSSNGPSTTTTLLCYKDEEAGRGQLDLERRFHRTSFATMRSEQVSDRCLPCPSLQYGSGVGDALPATHDISRVSYHVKQLDTFTQTLEAVRVLSISTLGYLPAIRNRHRSSSLTQFLCCAVCQQSLPQQGTVLATLQKCPGPPTALEDG